MRNIVTPLRLGQTAIAAVLALSSTPLVAQVVAPQAEAPLIAAPLAPSMAPAEATPAPVEAAPQTSLATAAPEPAPIVANGVVASNGTTIGTPVVHGADGAAEQAAPVARRAAARASVTPAAAVPVAMAAKTPAPAVAAPIVREATPAPRAAAPVATTTTTAASTTSVRSDDTAEWIGAGALALVLLAGGAYAATRRRREDGDDETYELTEAEPVVAAPAAMPVYARSNTEVAAVPAGFDLSRFGRHVQQAYRGPTADNPSFSLKKRLHRAAFFDQRERQEMETEVAMPAEMIPSRIEAPVLRGHMARDEQIVIRPAARPVRMSFRPAVQN